MAEMVFTIGNIASGKSTIASKLYAGFTIIDADDIKKLHTNYSPVYNEFSDMVHSWSLAVWAQQVQDAIKSGKGNYIVAQTGADSYRLVAQMKWAREKGFKVVLLSVRVSVETCLKRMHGRGRTIPEYLVREKDELIRGGFPHAKKYADELIKYDNETDFV
jgi:predicted kinase